MTKIIAAVNNSNFVIFAHFRRFCHSKKGFTLIEVLVAIFGFTMIVYGLIALVSNIFISSNQQAGLLADSDQARKLAFQIVKELRNSVTSSTGSYPLDTAGSQQIVFFSDIASTSGIERVRYFLQNGKLWKGVTAYNGATYNTSTEATYVVQNNVAASTTPIFYYYDGNYVGSSTQSSLTQPVNVTQVKFIKVVLPIYNKAGVQNTNTYTITASGAIRNLKTNLGN